MGKIKRSGVEIYLDILEAIRKGSSRRTHIMYRSNMSWHPLTERLSDLERGGCIKVERSGGPWLVSITKRGERAIALCRELVGILGAKSAARL